MYFNAGEWDGPMSLHDMMAVKNPEILALVSNYRINLITPGNMSDEEINRFTTSLREVMMFIKYSKEQEKLQEGMQQGMQTMIHNLMQSLDITAEKACELLKVNVADYEEAMEKLTLPYAN